MRPTVEPRSAESSLVALDDSRMVCYTRGGDSAPGLKSISLDGGQTWNDRCMSCFAGHRPCGGVLRSGKILVTFRLVNVGTCRSVTISYRRASFARCRRENRTLIEAAVRQKAVHAAMSSTVASIHGDHVILRHPDGSENPIANDAVIVTLVVLDGTVPAQSGRTFQDRLKCDGPAANRPILFGVALGLVEPSQVFAAQSQIDIPLEASVGRQVVVEMTRQEWKDRQTGEPRSKVGVSFAGYFSMASPEAAACPRGAQPFEAVP